MVSLIKALVDQKILTREKAADLLKQAGIDPSVLTQEAEAPTAPLLLRDPRSHRRRRLCASHTFLRSSSARCVRS